MNGHATNLILAAAALLLCAAMLHAAPPATAPAGQPRRAEDIMYELNSVAGELRQVLGAASIFDARRRTEVAPKAIPLIKRVIALIDEMDAFDPRTREEAAQSRVQFLALLAFMDDADGIARLKAGAQLKDAVPYVLAQLMVRWWKSPDNAAEQTAILDEMQVLARSHAEDDSIAHVLLRMSQRGVASRDLRQRAEGIILKDLRGDRANAVKADLIAGQKRRALEGRPITLKGNKLEGGELSTASLRGRVVLVHFWTTSASLDELREIKQLYKQYHAQGLEVVGVCSDSRSDAVIHLLEQNPDITWPQLFDRKSPGLHPLAREYGLHGSREMFLIDRRGTLRTTEAEETFGDLIPRLLAER